MEEQNLELKELYESSIADVKEGEIISGTIVEVGNKDILIDIGYKSEGVVHKSEVFDTDTLKVGGTLDVLLESKENDSGMVVVSHEKARKLRGWQHIVENNKEGDMVDGKVIRKVRGGFMVDVGLEAFLPASLSAMQETGGDDGLCGKKFKFKIVKINVPRKNIVLSRKEIVEEARREEKQELLSALNKGDIVKGIVKNITDFGAFIDIGGGITGLLHITDMSWGRITKPTEIMNVDDAVEVKILSFDKDSMKVSLGYKQKTQNPWEIIEEKYPEGSVASGKVVNIMPYGVFMELEEGIEGLIHISEFSWTKKFNHPSDKFSLADPVKAVVLKVDVQNQKLSLGLKQLEDDPWQGVEDRFKVGDKVTGTINTLTDYGAFVELESGVEGLVHVSDLSWTKRINHPKEMLQKGDEISAMILNVDEQNRRIALGVKQLADDPWEAISDEYQTGTICAGKVANITNFGIFVELKKDLEGLLHVSEIPLQPSQRMEDMFKVGDEVQVKVIHIDGIQKKIALTLKGFEPEEGAAADESQKEDAPSDEVQDTPAEAGEPEEAEPKEEASAPSEEQEAPASEDEKEEEAAPSEETETPASLDKKEESPEPSEEPEKAENKEEA